MRIFGERMRMCARWVDFNSFNVPFPFPRILTLNSLKMIKDPSQMHRQTMGQSLETTRSPTRRNIRRRRTIQLPTSRARRPFQS